MMPFVYLTLYVAKTLSINVPIIAMLESCSLNMAFLLIQHEFIVLVLWSVFSVDLSLLVFMADSFHWVAVKYIFAHIFLYFLLLQKLVQATAACTRGV